MHEQHTPANNKKDERSGSGERDNTLEEVKGSEEEEKKYGEEEQG